VVHMVSWSNLANPSTQIKYTELPKFSEVMAAGTAAALVPIRSVTRRFDPTSSQSITTAVGTHSRLSGDKGSELVTYIQDSNEDAGPLCLRLLTQLKGIQLGKVKDQFGWCFAVSEEDGTKVAGETKAANGNGHTIDQLD
jgi:branched-chain amino acid aminotransferase